MRAVHRQQSYCHSCHRKIQNGLLCESCAPRAAKTVRLMQAHKAKRLPHYHDGVLMAEGDRPPVLPVTLPEVKFLARGTKK